MKVEPLLEELQQRYVFLDADSREARRQLGIRETDVAGWARECDGGYEEVYNAFARFLAVEFNENRLSFEFCDAVVNDLHTVIVNTNGWRPKLFWEVFLAFDAGEYYRRRDLSDDPVADHTVPAIA